MRNTLFHILNEVHSVDFGRDGNSIRADRNGTLVGPPRRRQRGNRNPGDVGPAPTGGGSMAHWQQ